MPKVTPNPPETDPASPKENLDSPTAPTPDFQPSIADIKPTPRTLSTMFIVNPEFDIETLLGYACESLASAEVMANDLADHMTGSSRNSLLGISQVIMLAELTVNRALDHLDPIEDTH
ncbi:MULTISPECIES: DUF6124 family protein [Pseudomonas]|jgi:hypothetical protein|uniref:DUF3077 domain-containing protein n=1 Tax=Pseudomonas fluorescens NCIMB 11764 TaxID=1221522 RepID=A0A0K1QVX6_PSEFL|nr:DUF6124 family protein [Pseudomonas fluorescens]AKV09914.1 hypothetical protein B723_27340 [Pseudomonas fluorescens NCIMB 11764]MDZ4326816.1 DUF6124 family protein [Pseudomonas sp.]